MKKSTQTLNGNVTVEEINKLNKKVLKLRRNIFKLLSFVTLPITFGALSGFTIIKTRVIDKDMTPTTYLNNYINSDIFQQIQESDSARIYEDIYNGKITPQTGADKLSELESKNYALEIMESNNPDKFEEYNKILKAYEKKLWILFAGTAVSACATFFAFALPPELILLHDEKKLKEYKEDYVFQRNLR